MNIENKKLVQLQSTFPKLTEGNQQYVMGLAEGLKRAQDGRQKEMEMKLGKQTSEFGVKV